MLTGYCCKTLELAGIYWNRYSADVTKAMEPLERLIDTLLASARGLLAISMWSMDRRIIGPLSRRVDYLIAAIRIGE